MRNVQIMQRSKNWSLLDKIPWTLTEKNTKKIVSYIGISPCLYFFDCTAIKLYFVHLFFLISRYMHLYFSGFLYPFPYKFVKRIATFPAFNVLLSLLFKIKKNINLLDINTLQLFKTILNK